MYTIDAWLERSDPILRVFVTATGEEIIRWSGNTLREMLERGDLLLQDIGDLSLSLSERLGLTKELRK